MTYQSLPSENAIDSAAFKVKWTRFPDHLISFARISELTEPADKEKFFSSDAISEINDHVFSQ